MTVNTSPSHFPRQPTSSLSGQRLYLREDELDAGVELIFEASIAIKSAIKEVCARHHINLTQGRALSAIARKPIGVQALSVVLGLTKQATIKTVEELENVGFVGRVANITDGRRKTLVLTQTGADIARDVAGAMRNILARAYRQAGGEAVAGCDLVLSAIARDSGT
jgi:DNA-binding MarR family transcriptional regulator